MWGYKEVDPIERMTVSYVESKVAAHNNFKHRAAKFKYWLLIFVGHILKEQNITRADEMKSF